MTGNKEIAKNTVFLYIRMLFIIAVSLYSSRVVLNILGASDYGLYNVVGGVVAMLSFINGAASSGTSRFLTFYLGKEDNYNYQQVFSAAFYIHLGIAFIIFILGETAGLWFVNNKLIIEPGREEAALFVYHLSLITCFVTFTQVPYNASLIAHEKMDIYAYIGIVEAVLKLGILLVLKQSHYDKLKTYAILLLTISILIALFYRFYCHHLYKECRLVRVKNKKTVKNLIVYSSWDMYGNLSSIAQTQGINIVINMFLATVVNAARGIAYQVDAAVNNFISNFLTAVNPQIVKSYASGDYNRMISLVFNSCKYSVLLFSCLAIPLILCAAYVLNLWLVEPPKYAAVFTQWVLVNHFISTMSQPLIIGNHATGNVRKLNLVSGTVALLKLPMAYLMLKFGLNPVWIFVGIIPISFICFNVNAVLLKSTVRFSMIDFDKKTIFSCLLIMLVPISISIVVSHILPDSFMKLICITMIYIALLFIIFYKWGLSEEQKEKIKLMIRNYIFHIISCR